MKKRKRMDGGKENYYALNGCEMCIPAKPNNMLWL